MATGGVFAEISFLEPWGRGLSEAATGHLFPSYPEAEMWVIEQTHLHPAWLVTHVQFTPSAGQSQGDI